VFALALAFVPRAVPAQPQCAGERDATATAVTVHADTPTFSTGKGWTLAPQIAALGAGANVCVLERRVVGFIGSRKEWARIQFADGQGRTAEGWVAAAGLRSGPRLGSAVPVERLLLSWAGVARAETPGRAADPGNPSTVPILAMVFFAMLLGMAVKGLFDHLGEGIHARTYFLDTAKAFLVSPIVFLGFATGGDFSFTTGLGLFVYLCMSFQNGFFWQTVLTRAGIPASAPGRTGSAPPASA
jgi:hypothetical protein